jgi:hypothetical protein
MKGVIERLFPNEIPLVIGWYIWRLGIMNVHEEYCSRVIWNDTRETIIGVSEQKSGCIGYRHPKVSSNPYINRFPWKKDGFFVIAVLPSNYW